MTLDEVTTMFIGFDRPVINKTGITGPVAFRLVYEKGESKAGEPPSPSLVTAFREQLGLELQPAKGQRDFLVVDYAERPTPDQPALALGIRR
jgi:uncharacterized protein (TIGR03435 family)